MEKASLYKNILDSVFDGVYMVDYETRITYWNKGAERITGFQADAVIGRKCADNILNHINENGDHLCVQGCPLNATIMDGQPRQAEVFLKHAMGHRLPIILHAEPIKDDLGQIVGAVETFTDNSAIFSLENRTHQLQELVDRDALTDVASRRQVLNRLEASLIEVRTLKTRFGLIFLDLDHFKNINDEFGHDNGDKVLQMTANSIRHALRRDDVVGRFGGEEFLVILREVDEKILRSVAEKLRIMILNSLIFLDQKLVQVTVSIGGTLLNEKDTPELAIKRADEKMYQSKLGGRNRVTI
jgi:diguanylate cyclase (GGDEF)-like protein/PAS domain S-box-containing protein